MKESRRYYPKKELAAQLLGYVGVDNVGLGGIEAAYDSVVRGRDGKVLVQTDARRRGFSSVERLAHRRRHPRADHRRAAAAHRRARAARRGHRAPRRRRHARSSWIRTPARSWRWPPIRPSIPTPSGRRPSSVRKNRAVTDLYEPGSTFKIVTASAAIRGGRRLALRPDRRQRRDDQVPRPRRQSRTSPATACSPSPTSSPSRATSARSRSASGSGAERLGLYVNRFGFGKTTSPDFPGESPGIVWDPSRLNDSALASVSMGYQVGRHAAADGRRRQRRRQRRPAAAAAGRARHGQGRRRARRSCRSRSARPITARTAAELTSIMEDVVARGTGTAGADRRASPWPASRAPPARSSTAPTPSPTTTSRSSASRRRASRCSRVIVVVDTPRAGKYYGGSVSAPIFQDHHRRVAAPPRRRRRPCSGAAGAGRPPGADAEDEQPAPTLITVAPVDDSDGMPDLRGLERPRGAAPPGPPPARAPACRAPAWSSRSRRHRARRSTPAAPAP